MNSLLSSRLAVVTVAVVLGLTTSAFAGPPLVCHPIGIGNAKSLPLIDWNLQGTGGYDLRNLTNDTLAILDSNPSVLVHMETLRRATLYARKDTRTAKELLTRLHARAASSDATNLGALASFDVGYLSATYAQWLSQDGHNPASGFDGYSWVKKAISLRGEDREMEFAAALITLTGPEREHRDHVEKALAGSKTDPLLSENLDSHFGRQTISEVLARSNSENLRK